jgi:branched-chain amino acid transport system substrate-binding protein
MRTTSLILGLVTVLNASTALNAQEAVWKTQGVTKDEIVLGMHADPASLPASASAWSTRSGCASMK